MQLIYEKMLGGIGGDKTRYELLELDRQDEELIYIDDVVSNVFKLESELDEALAPHLVDWTLERLAKVDLSILRLACYEILYRPDIPASVSINEAIELAREYSLPEACAFINGVLGGMERARRAAAQTRA
jgi:N utilization substance protein B